MNFDHTPEKGDNIYENAHMDFTPHGRSCECGDREDHDGRYPGGECRGCCNDPEWDYCEFPVAMAYVPMQPWEGLYDLETGLRRGTIFPSLDKPFLGGGPR